MINQQPNRFVWYRARPGEGLGSSDVPRSAFICGVIDDNTVNLAVFGFDGSGPYPRQNVTLVQDEVQQVQPGQCGWMPYQRGQAAKNDADIAGLVAAEVTRQLGWPDRRLHIIGAPDPSAPDETLPPINPAPSAADVNGAEQQNQQGTVQQPPPPPPNPPGEQTEQASGEQHAQS
jgi:hypothetical protein